MAKKRETQYLADEAADMLKAGYVSPRVAAQEASVRIDRVYRAINAKKVRVRLGENAYNRYVHRGDWMKFIEKRREQTLASLGLDQ